MDDIRSVRWSHQIIHYVSTYSVGALLDPSSICFVYSIPLNPSFLLVSVLKQSWKKCFFFFRRSGNHWGLLDFTLVVRIWEQVKISEWIKQSFDGGRNCYYSPVLNRENIYLKWKYVKGDLLEMTKSERQEDSRPRLDSGKHSRWDVGKTLSSSSLIVNCLMSINPMFAERRNTDSSLKRNIKGEIVHNAR